MKKQKIFNVILAFVIFMLSFIGNAPCAFAADYAKEFDVDESNSYITAREVKDPSFLDKYTEIKDITISDSTITSEYNFGALNALSEMIFENCEFKTNSFYFNKPADETQPCIKFYNCKFSAGDMSLPQYVYQLTFDGTIYDNLGSINSLEVLEISNCTINDLTGISELTNLTSLNIDFCILGSLKGIEKLTKVCDLSLNSNIESLKRIEKLENLQSVYLNVPFVKDFSPLQNLEHLSSVYFDYSGFVSYDPILNFKSQNIQDAHVIASRLEAFSPQAIEFFKKYDGYELDEDIVEINKKLVEIKNEIIKDGMSDMEIIKTVSEYVVTNIDYDYDILINDEETNGEALCLEYNNRKLYYALDGKGICANYSALTASLLNMCGINCYEIYNDEHVWQLIELNGEYYWLDTTYLEDEWIDCDITECSSYMSQDNEEFIKNREALLIPSSLYNKLHNIPNDDFKDLEVPETTDIEQPQEQPETAKTVRAEKNPLVIIPVVICVSVSATIIILIIKKSRKRISPENNVDYIDLM